MEITLAGKTAFVTGGENGAAAYAAIYLATGLGSFITGEVIQINGGMYFA